MLWTLYFEVPQTATPWPPHCSHVCNLSLGTWTWRRGHTVAGSGMGIPGSYMECGLEEGSKLWLDMFPDVAMTLNTFFTLYQRQLFKNANHSILLSA